MVASYTTGTGGSARDNQWMATFRVPLNQHLQAIHRFQGFGRQDCVWSTVGAGATVLQQQQVIAITCRQVEVVQDHQDGHTAPGEIAHGLQDGVLVQRVEHRGRFVEQQNLSLGTGPQLRQHAGQVHTLALTPDRAR